MKFVMAGTVSIDIKWIDNLKIWFENNRPDHRFIFDVINVHHYSWLNGKNWQGGGPAKSPEEDHFKERLSELITYRDSNFPNTEVWISEFGWDTNAGSPLCVPLIEPYDREEVQGQWIVRAYLAFAAAGIDRAQLYMLRDVNSNSGRWFATCGLTKQKGDWTPKKSWYYVYTLKNTLRNMVFIGEQKSDTPNVLIYKFKDINNKSGAYVIWSKTKYNNEVKGYKLILDGHPTKAEQIEMVVGKTEGEKNKLTIDLNKVIINISERPIFVMVDQIN
jgi:hypothetical protein